MDTSDPFLNQSEHQVVQLKRRIRFLTAAYRVSWAILILLLLGAIVESGWWLLAVLPITGLLIIFALVGDRARSMQKTVEKHLVRSASEVMLQDSRPPLLYLRSFSDEPTTRQIPVFLSPRTFAEEQFLTTALTRVGPLVAIGRPGDPLPEVGANRLYVPDSEWVSVLSRLMGEAAGVIIRIGPGRGLDWEIRQALRRLPPERILIVLPRDEYSYAAFRMQFGELIPQPLPTLQVTRWRNWPDGFNIYGFLHFSSDWTAEFEFFNFMIDPSKRTVHRQFSRCLAPFIHQVTAIQSAPWLLRPGDHRRYRFNPPSTWPLPPKGWTPTPEWRPDPSWPPPEPDWNYWVLPDTDGQEPR